MKKLSSIFIVFALLFFVIMGCNEEYSKTTTDWDLVKIEKDGKVLSVENGDFPEKITANLTVSKNPSELDFNYQISGFAGVNNYSAQASLKKGNITVANIITTMMAGDEKSSSIETEFLQVLSKGGKLSFETTDGNTNLIIRNKDENTVLVFKEINLENTSWNLTFYNDGNAVVSVDEPLQEKITLGFGGGGQLFGNAAVNSFASDYETSDDGELSFGQIITTRMAGPAEMMELEAKIIELLSKVEAYEVSGKNLTLKDRNGLHIKVFA
jgi:heat shock protein HslJ